MSPGECCGCFGGFQSFGSVPVCEAAFDPELEQSGYRSPSERYPQARANYRCWTARKHQRQNHQPDALGTPCREAAGERVGDVVVAPRDRDHRLAGSWRHPLRLAQRTRDGRRRDATSRAISWSEDLLRLGLAGTVIERFPGSASRAAAACDQSSESVLHETVQPTPMI
jgi:hypothetical protein